MTTDRNDINLVFLRSLSLIQLSVTSLIAIHKTCLIHRHLNEIFKTDQIITKKYFPTLNYVEEVDHTLTYLSTFDSITQISIQCQI